MVSAGYILDSFEKLSSELRRNFGVSPSPRFRSFVTSLAKKVSRGMSSLDVREEVDKVDYLFYEEVKKKVYDVVLKDPDYKRLQRLARSSDPDVGSALARGIRDLLDSYRSSKLDLLLFDDVESRRELYNLLDEVDPDDRRSLSMLRNAVKKVPLAISDVAETYVLEFFKDILD